MNSCASSHRWSRLANHVITSQTCKADEAESIPCLSGVMRTPEHEFEVTKSEFPFNPRYTLVDIGLRMAYVDEGPESAKNTFLLLHGEPTYSYLYRKIIPLLAAAGHRVVVPDLIGFGRSDKPVDPMRYTFAAHLKWLNEFIENLNLHQITCFGHEWGGMLVLSLLVSNQARIHRIAIGNTHLIVPGNRPPWDLLFPYEGTKENRFDFLARRVFSPLENMSNMLDDTYLKPIHDEAPFAIGSLALEIAPIDEPLFFDTEDFDAGSVVNDLSYFGISHQTSKAYNAPFPSQAYKAGMRRFPMLVPRTPDDPCMGIFRKTFEMLASFDKPFLTAFAPADPLLNWADEFWQDYVPGARSVSHIRFKNSGHFLQEDQGQHLASVLNKFVADSSPS